MNVLLIDDDRELVEMLVFAFRRAGLTTATAHDVASGLVRFEQDRPDLVVLDLHLGGSNGFDFLQQVRARSQVPIIILTALASEDDKVKGLSLGADDYVTKPFSHRELIARVQMRLRHPVQAAAQPVPSVLGVADIELDTNAHTVQRAGRVVNLTVTEFRLLHHLLVNAGQVVRTEDILRHVWGNPDPTDSDVLRVTLHRLRRKLGESGANGIIRTVAGVGVLLQGERVLAGERALTPDGATDEIAAPVEAAVATSESVLPPKREVAAAPTRDMAVPATRDMALPAARDMAVPPTVAPPTAPRHEAPVAGPVPARNGRVERNGQDRMRLRFQPDVEVESVLFLMPTATLESYDAATDEVTWSMPSRGERVWDVFDVARRRGFTFAEDVDIPAPTPQRAATVVPTPVAAPAPVETKVDTTKEPAVTADAPARLTPRASALASVARVRERAAGPLERIAGSAAAAVSRGRAARSAPDVAVAPAVTTATTAPPAASTAPATTPPPAAPAPQARPARPTIAEASRPVPATTQPALRERLNELGSRMSASGRTAAMFIAVTMLAALLSIWAESVRLGLLSELERVGEISVAVYQQSEARQLLLAFTLLALYIASAIAFLVWIQRSYARLFARQVAGLRYTPITAVIWFLVPLAFLFVPRRVVSELWHASPVPTGGRVERSRRVPMLVAVWWTAFVAFAISAVLTGFTTPEPTITDLFRQAWTNVASDVLALAAAALAIGVIAAIELRQPAS